MIAESSIFQPLQQRRFRQLWLANLLSNLGSWGQSFALVWHVASLSQSVVLSALVQSVIWLPFLLFSLPAGILADARHKPRVLLFSNAVLAINALILSILSLLDVASATLLLSLTFITGIGNAYTLPSWQASMSELVKTEQVISVASLNNLSYNLAAFIGPCLGGMIYLRLGPAPLYLFNALSFCGLLYLYFRWQRQVPKEIRANLHPPCNRIQSADRAFATALRNKRFRCLLVYSLVIFCLSNTFAALLPSLVGDIATATGVTDPNQYGIRMGALGIGAIFAALVLPKLRAICAERVLLSMALCVFGLMLVCLAITSGLIQHVCLIISGGVAWSAIVTSLNSAALRSFPAYMRARSLSLYILVTAAGQASGGLIWGALAHQFGVTAMMIAAGLAMLSCAVLVFNARDFLEKA